MKLLTDNPISSIEGDQFGFKSYACILKDTILGSFGWDYYRVQFR